MPEQGSAATVAPSRLVFEWRVLCADGRQMAAATRDEDFAWELASERDKHSIFDCGPHRVERREVVYGPWAEAPDKVDAQASGRTPCAGDQSG